jgi:hypothetical protein
MASLFSGLARWFRPPQQQPQRLPEQALDDAYNAVLLLRAIEDEYFQGGAIEPDVLRVSSQQRQQLREEVQRQFRQAREGLEDFLQQQPNRTQISPAQREKLQIVEQLLQRYRRRPGPTPPAQAIIPVPAEPITSLISPTKFGLSDRLMKNVTPQQVEQQPPSYANQTSFLPRSLLGTFGRLRRELDPEAEQEAVNNFRNHRQRTIAALRFVLLMALVPLLTQQIAKNFLVGPIVDQLRSDNQEAVFLNRNMEEEALQELQHYKERLEFQRFITKAPPLTDPELEDRLKARADEIAEEFRYASGNAIKNVFSDILGLVAFGTLISLCKEDIAILKSFIDEVAYGLSDSAKAFIIILFTDMFVGFHSPHGWEVILEGIAAHFGLPERRSFIFLFIATFPVILDTVFKYWIFRYLNRIAPSAVATYRNMNE